MAAPSIDALRKMLRYNPETGELFWLARTPDMFDVTPGRTPEHSCANWNAARAGKPALTADCGAGYRQGNINGRRIRAHTAAWALATGAYPQGVIDHINGDRADNRLCNLREVTQAQNVLNCRVRKHNKLGLKGVKKWGTGFAAQIRKDGVKYHLGRFDTPEEAQAAYARASAELHGEFGRVA